ncbi:quinone-dependent dihydroorotate dehydrogenase [Tepidamorphus sp. 3E244]|uniref:quinone-dependent dihydroorotate dehydrogenase n=1 Tax=Tepidamorphus sp. 3E244 TaxID=3385498 RepID=UPI0038FC99AE
MFERIARAAQPFLQQVDAERAHELAIEGLRLGLHPRQRGGDDPALAVRLWDLEFPNPLGMAAGFDKNGVVPDALVAMGLGFAECGTVTPRQQAGNPKPRVFRIKQAGGVINRLGFNNNGHDAMRERLLARRRRGGVVGVNIGANKDTEDKAADYVAGIEAFADLASYFTVNVSSPNTPGLRDLQRADTLGDLLARVLDARDKRTEQVGRTVPVALKIAPDIDEAAMDEIADVVAARKPDALIVSNTTITRPGVAGDPTAAEAGGLSGKPLFPLSTAVLARMRQRIPADMPMIGVGGVTDALSAYEKVRAGATLVQIYTGLVYGGFQLIGEIKHGMADLARADGHASVTDAVGSGVADWASRPLD